MGMYGPEFVWILNPNAGTVDEWFKYTNRAIDQDKIKTEQTCNKTQYQKALNRAFTFKALMIREDDNFTTSSNLVRIFFFVNAAPSVRSDINSIFTSVGVSFQAICHDRNSP